MWSEGDGVKCRKPDTLESVCPYCLCGEDRMVFSSCLCFPIIAIRRLIGEVNVALTTKTFSV